MFFPASHFRKLAFGAFFTVCAHALEIRQYNPSRHDRFITGANGVETNTDAYYSAGLYAAVAFGTNNGDGRQFALVTPEHVLFARHFSFGGNIRFISPDGTAVNRSIAENIEVPNGSGGISDLIIMRLSAPVTENDRITPFPYLNLANEAAYNGTVLTTFGQNLRGGRGVISSFSNFSQTGPPAIGSTRTFTFRHNVLSGNADDAFAVTGDSGSPTFAIANGKPALVGVHLAASQGTFSNITTDTFVPHYKATVNGLIAPSGYQLIPAFPETVSLSSSATGDPLRQAFSGTVDIELANGSAATATNVRFMLIFPQDAVPDSVSAPGWIVENPAPGDYRLRTATLAGNSSSTLTVSFTSVPVVTEISIAATHRSDGSPENSRSFDLPVAPTFAGFVSGLSLKGETDDPDLDGFGNLIEYAFGGDPGSNSALAEGGQPLAPVALLDGGTFTYCYPRRTDAVARGVTYGIEFSETLETGSWSETPPSGFSVSSAPYAPDSPGFEKVTATFPVAEKCFIRVNVALTD